MVAECKISFRPQPVHRRVRWSQEHRLWWHCGEVVEENRWWNSFGLRRGEPEEGQVISIISEANVPIHGTNRQVGGVFAEDAQGRVFLAHRGWPMGGGKAGMTRERFWSRYTGASVSGFDEEGEVQLAFIGAIDDPELIQDVATFMRQVRGIKEGAGIGRS